MPEYVLDTTGRVDQPGLLRALIWSDLDAFTQGYIEALFFTETDVLAEQATKPGAIPFEPSFGFSDLAPEALARIISDCAAFQASGTAWCTYAQSSHVKNSADAATDEQAGGDFWFTRNRHGVGFWEREPGVYGDHADALTDAAYAFSEVDAYLGDDGRVYL